MFEEVLSFIKSLFSPQDFIPLHQPTFTGKEKKYVNAAIDSTFVSSVGEFVTRLEEMVRQYTGAGYAVATVNGTAALHAALLVAGVQPGDEVITQPLSFVATANAISYCGAQPIFLDVDRETMGLSPTDLETFLSTHAEIKDNRCFNRTTGKKVTACVPMHTFGHSCRIEEIIEICNQFHIQVVEDAAEALGSTYKSKHAGTFGLLGVYSLNGNKTITCGGGGVIVTDDKKLAAQAKHLTTTAKKPHPYLYHHDQIGYNYRMPNLNAAMACAQMESLAYFIANKRQLAAAYKTFFSQHAVISFFTEPDHCKSNYWLNALIMPSLGARNTFLQETNDNGIMTRPAWELLPSLPIYANCQTDKMTNARWLADRIVNIPSSVRP